MVDIPRGVPYAWGESDPTRFVQAVGGNFDIVGIVQDYRSYGRVIQSFVQNNTVGGGQQWKQEFIWTPGFLLRVDFPYRDIPSGNRIRLIIIPAVDIRITTPLGWIYQ